MIETINLSFAYKEQQGILNDINISVPDGELLLLHGESGRGKTTLLHCMCGVIPRNISGKLSGEIRIDGIPVTEISAAELPKSVAIIFQDLAGRMFYPTVEDEMAFVMENLCVPRQEMRERIEDVLERLGLIEFRERDPARLSGGQQKLAALASALVIPPRVLLLDEITSGLDDDALEKLFSCLDWLRGKGSSVIVSDHRPELWNDASVYDFGGMQ